ncbi:MAG: biopolymer transport protein ExbB [Verrucomicrobiales bacterium]|jgi:biopolymer transport protein ExbB
MRNRQILTLLFFGIVFFGAFAYAQNPGTTPPAPPADPAATADAGDPEAEAPATAPVKDEIKFKQVLKDGGVMMYPLYGLSFVAVLLIFYYVLTIRQGTVVSDKFMNAADALIRKQDYLGLIAVCNRENEAIARITYKTLDFATKNPTASFEEVREVTEAEGSRQSSILNQRITYLADVGSISPMVGLLGTVLGMIKSFHDMNAGGAPGAGQVQMSVGVSQALVTTASGLFIGIPSLIFYSIFRGKVQKLISELEAAMTHLMALLAAQYKRANYRASARSDDGKRRDKGV